MKAKKILASLVGAAILILMMVVVVSAKPAQQLDPGEGNSYIWFMDTSGSGARVDLSYFDSDDGSSPVTVKPYTLTAYASMSVGPTDVPELGSGWNGTVIVSSDVPVAANVYNTYSNLVRAASYRGSSAPAMAQYMPFINYKTNVRDFNLAVFNVSGATASITMTYYTRDGDQDFVETDSIGSGEQAYYDTTQGIGVGGLPDFNSSPYAATHNGVWAGGVLIESDQNIAAVLTTHYDMFSSQYSGSSVGDAVIYVPYASRRRQSLASVGYAQSSTNISVQNLEDHAIDVTYTLIDNRAIADGGIAPFVLTDTVPAFAVSSFNTIAGGPKAWLDKTVLTGLDRFPPGGYGTQDTGQDQWVGSMVVEATGDIAAVATTIRNDNQTMGQFSGASAAAATNQCFFPRAHRIQNSGFDIDGKYIYIRLQNPNSSPISYTVHFLNTDGTEMAGSPLAAANLDGERSTNFWTKHGDYSFLGTSWTGAMWIEATGPLSCVGDAQRGLISQWSFEANW